MITPYTHLISTMKKLTHQVRLQLPKKTATQTTHAYMVHPIDIDDEEAPTSKVRLQLVNSSKTTTQTTRAFILYPNFDTNGKEAGTSKVRFQLPNSSKTTSQTSHAFISYSNSIPMARKQTHQREIPTTQIRYRRR